MPKKAKLRKPGSAKGVAKPLKRPLDPGFGERLQAAIDVQTLPLSREQWADKFGMTRQTLHNYLKGEKRAIETFLLFQVCDELDISPRWLLKNEGSMRPLGASDPIRKRINEVTEALKPKLLESWVAHGESLVNSDDAGGETIPPHSEAPRRTGPRSRPGNIKE